MSTTKKPTKVVTVTGAAGQIGYSIVFMIAQGRMLGDDQPIELRLLDLPQMHSVLVGVSMELDDCAFPLLVKTVATSDYKEAFEHCDVAMLIGARPRGPGMDRKDLLQANASIFEGQGKALNEYASRNVKVLVVGNPANTNALIAKHFAPSLPASAFTAMTRLDQNRAKAQLAKRLGTDASHIKNVIVWGNHSNTQYPDVNHAVVIKSTSGESCSIRTAVQDDEYLNQEFIKTVQLRGGAIIEALKKSSAASAAKAAVDHVHDWLLGTAPGEYVSMGVFSDGSHYGVPNDLVFSFPVQCKDGEWTIVDGLTIDAFSQQKLHDTAQELLEERKSALNM